MDNYYIGICVMIILNAISVLLISISLSLVIFDSIFGIKKRIGEFAINTYIKKSTKRFHELEEKYHHLYSDDFCKEVKELQDKMDKFEKFWNP